ncbi:hypothetical protein PHJA_002891800 [Phtheirospermum japonicum]|uniref:Hydroxyproline-rich glycoprotein family protein n=1 Tax=Phtheirospermum japonicum TaxID=374723 RepID=A0A830D6Z1_9LAMI|nr:hypothetical protein PHJA_002891800 [Phtheirospermum japonicum]
MRGKSSSSKSKNAGLEFEKPEKLKEPNLSGAYIRSLVKQLSSSRTRDSSDFKEHEILEGDGISSNGNLHINPSDGFSDKSPGKADQPPQQHKKQVRRRLHTSRPYQERLLNMAEARREIVTALKFHRASMKQASDNKQEQQQSESRPEIQPASSHHLSSSKEAKLKSRRNPRIYASTSSFPNNYPTNYPDNFPYSSGFCSPYSWPVPPITPPPQLFQENLNFTLPSQTLGLNLNLQDFNYFDSAAFHCGANPSSIYSSSTSSSPLSATTDEIPFVGPPISVASEVADFGDSGLHHAMDDKEMAEIRSIGEQYQMEWNDTLNLVNSAWWFKFLKAMELSPEDQKDGEDFMNYPFDEVVEFPAWLNANEERVNDFCSGNYVQDPDLPCMDIEEIDGMDGDWLA